MVPQNVWWSWSSSSCVHLLRVFVFMEADRLVFQRSLENEIGAISLWGFFLCLLFLNLFSLVQNITLNWNRKPSQNGRFYSCSKFRKVKMSWCKGEIIYTHEIMKKKTSYQHISFFTFSTTFSIFFLVQRTTQTTTLTLTKKIIAFVFPSSSSSWSKATTSFQCILYCKRSLSTIFSPAAIYLFIIFRFISF